MNNDCICYSVHSNRHLVADSIKEEMGAETTVVHKCGTPFLVFSEVDGKTSKKECLPGYYVRAMDAHASSDLRHLRPPMSAARSGL